MNVMAILPLWALVVLKAVIWASVCWGAVRLAGSKHPAFQVMLCRAALLSLVVLMVLAVYGPTMRVPITARPMVTVVAAHFHDSAQPMGLAEAPLARAAADSSSPVAPSAARFSFPSISATVIGLWLLGAFMLFVRLGTAVWACGRMAGGGAPADASLIATGDEVAAMLHMRGAPTLRITSGAHGPLLVGYLRPVVLLPRDLVHELDEPNLHGVLLHEFSHVRTRDLWWKLAFEVTCVLMWVHPAVWRIARMHEVACEKACDAAAARLSGDGMEYRRTLARVALRGGVSGVRLAIPMARPAAIAQRICALAEPVGVYHAKWGRATRYGAVTCGLVAAFAALSCYRQGPGGLYEKAPIATGSTFTLGPTTFTLDAVARWDRDGSVRVEDGHGVPAVRAGALVWDGRPSARAAAASWLDVAEIRIGPEADVFDVTELRVFDHATQKMIGFNDGKSAGFTVDGRVLRVMSMGDPLPDALDVWLRVRHRPATDPTWRIPATGGASTSIDGVAARIREVRQGPASGYQLRGGSLIWTGPVADDDPTYVVLDIADPGRRLRGRRFQLCAIDDEGMRHWSDYFVSVDNVLTQVHSFYVAPERIRFVELSPLHEERRFYFEDVRLPARRSQPLSSPPPLTIDITGEQKEYAIDLVGEGDLRATTYNGNAIDGTYSRDGGLRFDYAALPGDTGLTVAVFVDGLCLNAMSLTLLDRNGEPFNPNTLSTTGSNSPQGTAYACYADVPLSQLAQVRVDVMGRR